MGTIEKLADLEQKDRIKAQNQFLGEISSLTGKFSLSSNCTCCISNVTYCCSDLLNHFHLHLFNCICRSKCQNIKEN